MMRSSGIFFVAALLAAIIAAGCVSNPQPITELTLQGHPEIFQFSNDIRQSILVKADHQQAIQQLFASDSHWNVIFNGTDQLDNGMFRIALIDINAKIPPYFADMGRPTTIDIYYFLSDNGTQWYNSNDTAIAEPNITGLTLWMKGPATGANETSITLVNTTVYVQGASAQNISLAADKLVLIVFGINDIKQVNGA